MHPSSQLHPQNPLVPSVRRNSIRPHSRRRWLISSCHPSYAAASASNQCALSVSVMRPEPFDKLRTAPVEGQRLHVAGVLLPAGEYRDLWVVDGVIRSEPVSDAQTIATR